MNVVWNVIITVVPFLTGVVLDLLIFLGAGVFWARRAPCLMNIPSTERL